MAGSLNKVLLIGRLGVDPEIKQMVNGKSVARLSLATSQSWKDKNTYWRKQISVQEIEELKNFKKNVTTALWGIYTVVVGIIAKLIFWK